MRFFVLAALSVLMFGCEKQTAFYSTSDQFFICSHAEMLFVSPTTLIIAGKSVWRK